MTKLLRAIGIKREEPRYLVTFFSIYAGGKHQFIVRNNLTLFIGYHPNIKPGQFITEGKYLIERI